MANFFTRKGLAIAAGVASLAISSISTPAIAAEDPHLTAYDRMILSFRGYSGHPLGANTNQEATDYCQRVGFGPGPDQCNIKSFYEEKRISWVPNNRKRISDLQFNCTGSNSSKTVGWSYSNNATHSAGVTVGTSVTVTVKAAPFGAGADTSLTASVAASYGYAWGSSSTQSGSDTLSIRPGYVGWFDRASFNGTAHGVATVWLAGDLIKMRPGYYSVVTDISGDLGAPTNPYALSAQPVIGLVAQERPMTDTEKTICASSSAMLASGSGSTGTPTSSKLVKSLP